MSSSDDKKRVQAFLEDNRLAILSTVDESGHPHAAPVYYISNDTLEMLFATSKETQKFQNIEQQDSVVLTITDEEKRETMQVRGKARIDDSLLKGLVGEFAKKLNKGSEFITTPPALQFTGETKTVVVVTPSEIRYRLFENDHKEEIVL